VAARSASQKVQPPTTTPVGHGSAAPGPEEVGRKGQLWDVTVGETNEDRIIKIIRYVVVEALSRVPLGTDSPKTLLAGSQFLQSVPRGTLETASTSFGVGWLEGMEYLENLHPSVFEGEFNAIADTAAWLDLEIQHGDASRSSRRYFPLAWLAVTLLKVVGALDGSNAMTRVCCQAVQLLDPEGAPAFLSLLGYPHCVHGCLL